MRIKVISNTGRFLAMANISDDYIPFLHLQEKVLYKLIETDSEWSITWKDYSKFVNEAIEV